jgi:hypothetical protein
MSGARPVLQHLVVRRMMRIIALVLLLAVALFAAVRAA